jgi:formylglycine-generating enzyme required for sulfatase activity
VFIKDRTVTLSDFRIARYETTWQLWKEVCDWATDSARGANVYTFANTGAEPAGSAAERAARPVTNINWRDAVIWCNAYSEMSGKEAVYYDADDRVLRVSTNDTRTGTPADGARMKNGADGYRLPTQAEWEFAARGGDRGAAAWAYPFAGSAAVSDVAWYEGNSGYSVHPVGKKAANSKGVYDMSGNVQEMCWDWYGVISTAAVEDPAGPDSGSYRVVRGGSWDLNMYNCGVTANDSILPGLNSGGRCGFRVVCP